ncbi:toprim domain-containing protein [Methylobacterium sp. Leaf108]|uniref:DUF7146 domain-containing protein n=1 Tax=Methylobacterium sp. Leaf108 TaxID=1736256 RepID=UPI00138EFCF5|nr:toprim domain-containing protein [Methylobacterium sp. Leaf108]
MHSHAGDDWRAVKDHVMARLGRPVSRRGDVSPRTEARAKAMHFPNAGMIERSRRAVDLLDQARDPQGTLVERYLASRALRLPDRAPEVLRFHPSCPFGDSRMPTMIAALRSIITDELQAVHRTALTAEGAKVGRKMLGPAGGAAVKLDADAEITAGLVIGEGIETCLAAQQLGLRPVWALGSVGAIRAFPVLPGIEHLTILVETDDGGASAAAVQECGTRWHGAGREVTLAASRIGGDMNDAIREARR